MNIGVNNFLFGGEMLAWIDEAGFIFAQMETGKTRFVTKSLEKVEFKRPVLVNSVVEICGKKIEQRTKGISVELIAKSEGQIVCQTQMIFVHIDEDGKPMPM